MTQKMNGFGKRLAWLRKKFGMTQRELADAIHTTDNLISNYETGEVVPSAARLQALADVFGVSMDALWRGKRKQKERSGANGLAAAGEACAERVPTAQAEAGRE